MLGQKGQEAAPFELLIAVIIMGFVMLAGVTVMGILKDEECKGQLDSQMEKIKTAIEDVASGAGQRDFSFFLPDCFNRGLDESGNPVSKFKILNKRSRQVCAAFCPGTRVECILLWFSTEEYHNVKCLRISTVTNFPIRNSGNDTSCDDFSPDKFDARNLKENQIDEGQYLLVRKFNLSNQSADICAYKKTAGS